jgi:3-phenylpropionate/trans-cinnamate dioxygenase ferredoxin reductase component
MQTTRCLIVGGGLTGDAACKDIPDMDSDGAITHVGDEPHLPHARPSLSKALLKAERSA